MMKKNRKIFALAGKEACTSEKLCPLPLETLSGMSCYLNMSSLNLLTLLILILNCPWR
jgi:hypothetical protein